MALFLIWQEKKVPFGGRISCDLMSTSGVLQCVSPIMEIQSVFGRILLMEGFTMIFFLIFWAFAEDPHISLWALKQSASLLNCFRIPMFSEAYNELPQLQNFLDDLHLVDQDGKDSWIYIWGQYRYSSSKYYHYHFRDIQPNLTILWIWKSKCIPKIKFFAWLLLNDRLNTRNILRRRRKFFEDGYSCVLCLEDVEESVEHLFFDCNSTACRWFALGITWNAHLDIHQKIQAAELDFAKPFFMEIFMIGAWCI
jgi:hypothetical protein